jgi:hypothetical protein
MTIQNIIGLFLLVHVEKDAGQDDMFEDVSEIAGVIDVAIIHG